MVSVKEAWEIISDQKIKITTEEIPITESVGRVLGQRIKADRDFPPFDRVVMDGVALQFSQLDDGKKSFQIAGTQAAGAPQQPLSDLTSAMEVMTGAVLPEGADTVIRYEDIDIKDNHADIKTDNITRGANIHFRASDAKAGDDLLEPGVMISPAEVALMASVGLRKVQVYAFPSTAVVSTGDELVDNDIKPEPHQIRQSNAFALMAAMRRMGWTSRPYYLTDNETLVHETLNIILSENDVVIISGGVSAGRFDFIPTALDSLGVKRLFHQVKQRPGKPFWFGAADKKNVVFALPGNPVSTYLCFYKYVAPWIFLNFKADLNKWTAVLAEDFDFEPEITYFLQVRTESKDGVLVAYPMPGISGDFVNLKNIDGFLELPDNKAHFKKGEAFPFIPFRV